MYGFYVTIENFIIYIEIFYQILLHMSSQNGQNNTSSENFPLRRISVSMFPHFLHLVLCMMSLTIFDLKEYSI